MFIHCFAISPVKVCQRKMLNKNWWKWHTSDWLEAIILLSFTLRIKCHFATWISFHFSFSLLSLPCNYVYALRCTFAWNEMILQKLVIVRRIQRIRTKNEIMFQSKWLWIKNIIIMKISELTCKQRWKIKTQHMMFANLFLLQQIALALLYSDRFCGIRSFCG